MKWITRERPKIDRISCPWLISRFSSNCFCTSGSASIFTASVLRRAMISFEKINAPMCGSEQRRIARAFSLALQNHIPIRA